MATYRATNYNAPAASHGFGANVKALVRTVTCSSAPTTSDTLEFGYLPSGATVIGGYIEASDMDTNGTPALTLHVGDSGDADRYFASSTVGQAGTASTSAAVAGLGYTTTAKTLVTGTAGVDPATGAAGTVTVCILYVVA